MILTIYASLFLFGCVLLFYGADWLIRGAANISENFGIPKSVAGLALVALGTSAPELFLNLLAAADGETDIALSNVSGSNLVNLCVGFGLCAFVGRTVVSRKEFGVDAMLLLLTPMLIVAAIYLDSNDKIAIITAGPLTAVLVFFILSLRRRTNGAEVDIPENGGSSKRGFLLFTLGVGFLYGGSELILMATDYIATSLSIPDDIIAITIIAAGTSIPDVTASVVAARRGENAIAVGNLLGSNISNVLLVLNGTILVSGEALAVDAEIRGDYLAVSAVSAVVCSAALVSQSIPRWLAFSMLGAYVVYIGMRVQAL